jgi:glutamine amidotransferase-like uncharacterized protein
MTTKKKILNIAMIIGISCSFLIPTGTSLFIHIEENLQLGTDATVVSVALYECWGVNNRYIMEILNYTWAMENQLYRFNVTVIDDMDVKGEGNITLTRDNFDVFIIGASARSYLIDGLNCTWRSNVRDFVANGGGYLGICGGANAGSFGFEKPKNIFHRWVNQGVLGLADVHIIDNFLGEWQYLIKFGFDAFWNDDNGDNITPYYASINTTVEKNQGNAIFSGYGNNFIDITYAGGPGMYAAYGSDDKLGTIIPLLRYNEELMDSKPLHYWIPTLNGWRIVKQVTTNLEDRLAGVATTYNSSGRVVLYGPHPEDRVVVNGYVKEYLGRSMINFVFPFETYVFNYYGTQLDRSCNWWIIRRSVAWAAQIPDVDLPPIQ